MARKRILLVTNPVSGRHPKGARASIGAELRLAGYEVTECQTSPIQAENQTIYAAAKEYDAVVLSGGDGTLNALVNGLMNNGCTTPILFIPTGSTNDFAKSLQLPGVVSESIKPLRDNTSRPLDIGLFNEKQYFTYIASMGVFTDISYSTPQEMKNWFGHAAYVLHGIANLPREFQPIKATVSTEHAIYQDEFLFCSISNTISIGGLLSMSSDKIRFDDGLFEVLLIHKPRNAQELWNTMRALVGQTYLAGDVPGIDFFHTSQLHVQTEGMVPWTLDGEYGGQHDHVTLEVLSDQIQLIGA